MFIVKIAAGLMTVCLQTPIAQYAKDQGWMYVVTSGDVKSTGLSYKIKRRNNMSDILTPLKIAGAYYINDMVKKRDVEDVNGVWMFGCFDVDAKELVKSINGYAELKHENEALREREEKIKAQLSQQVVYTDELRQLMSIDLITIGWLEDIIAELRWQRKKDAIDGQNALDELNQEVVELKAQLAEQVVYTDELQQLIRAGFMQGGKYRDLFKSEREDVFNTLNPSPELLAQHDAEVIEERIKVSLTSGVKLTYYKAVER